MFRYHMSLILKSFFFDQTGCQYPANGRMVLLTLTLAEFLISDIPFLLSIYRPLFYMWYIYKCIWILFLRYNWMGLISNKNKCRFVGFLKEMKQRRYY